MIQILLAITLLFAPPTLTLNWNSSERTDLKVQVAGEDEFIQRCAKSGLTVRYRYLVRLCRDRSLWFDACSEERMIIKSMRYDPITESYHLTTDLIGDGEDASTDTATALTEAFSYLNRLDRFPLSLVGAEPPYGGSYITVEMSAGCKSEYSETFAKLSSVLSLGMVTSGVIDSGRITFRLDQ